MKVTLSFDVDTDAWARDHDTDGMLASEVRDWIRDEFDETIRTKYREDGYVLPRKRRPQRR